VTEVRIEGLDVVLSGQGASALLVSSDLILRRGVERTAWSRAARSSARSAYPSQGRGTYLSDAIRLSPPLRAGELRRRLLAFVREVRALER